MERIEACPEAKGGDEVNKGGKKEAVLPLFLLVLASAVIDSCFAITLGLWKSWNDLGLIAESLAFGVTFALITLVIPELVRFGIKKWRNQPPKSE